MKTSVIIPVWNGATVIGRCLEALFTYAHPPLLEVICVDNASVDDSTQVVIQFPQARLLRQPVNLGFAGGVNVGMAAARGDLFVLLNQDCLVHEGWLTAITNPFRHNPKLGILGGILYNQDGTIDHAGAYISRPEGYGVHETAVANPTAPYPVDYVTGALFAIRRAVWQAIGPLDENFYPGYFEESDYCYRARAQGYEIACAPNVQATHLHSSIEWQKDPIKHNANQHRSRYRFIAKHFTVEEFNNFIVAEEQALCQPDVHPHQTIGRLLALRDTLRELPDVAAGRQHTQAPIPPTTVKRMLQVGFTHLLRRAWAYTQETVQTAAVQETTGETAVSTAESHTTLRTAQNHLQRLQAQEYALLHQIYFRHPQETKPESWVRRVWRLLVLRPLSFLTLRDYLLLSQLNTLHVARLDQLTTRQNLLEAQFQHRLGLLEQRLGLLEQRLGLLETLTDYEYR